MNDELKKKLIRNILNRLSSHKFAVWYGEGGTLDRWICGDEPTEQIEKDIETLFLHDLP